jgi:predicted esterase
VTEASEALARTRERVTSRTARYVVLGAEPAAARRIWFVLHGYGMLAARFARPFASVIPADTCIVAPEALSRFYLEMPRVDGGHLQRVGAAWLTRESRESEIADAHRWLTLVHDEVVEESTRARGERPLTAVLAFSQGVATAIRWIATGAVSPTMFVAWAGGLAADVDPAAFATAMRAAELVVVWGTTDPFATEEHRETIDRTVRALPVRARFVSFDGAHHLDEPLLAALLSGLGESPRAELRTEEGV